MDKPCKGDYTISMDRSKLDFNVIHGFLSQSYWSKGIPEDMVRKSIENSWCFGVYNENGQIGFARVVTDRCTFAWLTDVFIIPEYQGRGLGKWLVSCIVEQPELKQVRNFLLGTRDAHTLYARYGFKPLEDSERFMVIRKKDLYVNPKKSES